jgi:deoxyribonuclease-1
VVSRVGLQGFVLVIVLSLVDVGNAFAKGWGSDSVRDRLHDLAAQGHRAMGYKDAKRVVIGQLDVVSTPKGLLGHEVYCQIPYPVSRNGGDVDSGYSINVEHTWPQSKFAGNERVAMKSDMHHLYPTDSQMNSTRSSLKFGDVVRPKERLKCPVSEMGYNTNGELRFEPPTTHRGNVARALFYFSVRYNLKIDTDEEQVLRQWHREDPVDAEDLRRNETIAKYQGNRNPFIDHPEAVDQVEDF